MSSHKTSTTHVPKKNPRNLVIRTIHVDANDWAKLERIARERSKQARLDGQKTVSTNQVVREAIRASLEGL